MNKLFSALSIILALVLLTVIPAIAGEGRDEVESNDSRSLADSIDEFVIRGHMDEEDGDDWFVLAGQEGFHPTFIIYFDDEEVEVDFAVYSDDEQVGEALDWGTEEEITCQVPSVCYVHVWWWDGEGDYEIEIIPGSDECAGEDEIEPNDEIDLADLIDGLEINGYICVGDEDWFVLDGQEGTNPTFTIYFDDEDFEIDFEIYSDEELIEGAYDWGSKESITCRVPGLCHVYVYYYEGEGEYTIEIEP